MGISTKEAREYSEEKGNYIHAKRSFGTIYYFRPEILTNSPKYSICTKVQQPSNIESSTTVLTPSFLQ